jgi:DNA polymerase elongation subunit (family B)
MFYTDVSRSGNNILFSGYENGEKVNRKYQFEPSLYLPNSNGNLKCIDGTQVSEKCFNTISEANQFIKDYKDVSNQKIYGMQNWIHQWIAKNLPLNIKFDPFLINILTFDIEVDSEGEGFPDPAIVKHPITAISFHFSTDPNTYYCISTAEYSIDKRTVVLDKNVIYYRVASEMDLLRTFISLWQSRSPDIITGYNVQFFDIPYIVNRLNRLFGDGFAKCLSPWNLVYEKEKRVNNEMRQTFEVVGIQMLDYIDIIKKFGVALETPENYQLNTVAELILGEGKVDFSGDDLSLDDLYHQNPQKFIDYNIKDTYLVVAMEDRVKFLQIAIMLAYKTGTNFKDSLGTTAVWDALIHRVLLKEHTVIPPINFSSTSKDFEGAYVKEPQVGIHKWVVSFDFASLYPNIIIQHNISPETIVNNSYPQYSPKDFIQKGIVNREHHYSMLANGVLFRKDVQGIIPRLVESIYNERVKLKNEMLDYERQLENEQDKTKKDVILQQISILKNSQHSLKILLNSLYGALGSKFFRYYDLRMAEGITLTGQLAFHFAANAVNKKLSQMLKLKSEQDFVVTGDTDSGLISLDLFVEKFNPKSPIDFVDSIANEIISPAIDSEMDRMCAILSGYKKRLVMKRENICSGFFVAKKHYALLIYDSEGGIRLSKPKLKIKGIAAIKSSTPKAIRNSMKDIFLMILEGKKKADIIKAIDGVKKIFNSLPPEKIAFPRSVNNIEKWQIDIGHKSGTPVQVKASIAYNQLLKEHHLTSRVQKIRSGDKIRFVYLKMPNPINQEVIGFLNKLPEEFGLIPYIDYPKMFRKTFLDTIDPILEKIGFGSSSDSSIDTFSFFN